MPFWGADHSADPTLTDPKRKFRFLVLIDGMTADGGAGNTNIVWYAKTATKPGFSIAAGEHSYLNHKFYYPGTVTWSDVTITFVDPQDPDVTAQAARLLDTAGYKVPSDTNQLSTLSKAGMASAVKQVTIKQLNAAGNPIETWKLWNPIITDLKFGDLAYGDDNLVELSITFKYDWAELTPADQQKVFSPSNS